MTKQTKSPTERPKEGNQSKKKVSEEKTVDSQEEQVNWKDKYMRSLANYQNREKRIAKQYDILVRMANERLIIELLPILEDFERAISADKKAKNKFQMAKEGIQIIHEKLFKILRKQGLSPIKVTKGDFFDSDYHEALTTVPVKDDKLKDKVVEVVTGGYLLDKKVIQVAKVIIGK